LKDKINIIFLQQVLFALFLVSFSISEILGTSFYPGFILIPSILMLFSISKLRYKMEFSIVKKNEIILIFSFIVVSLYSFFWSIQNNFTSISKTLDLILIFTFYFIGKELSKRDTEVVFKIVMFFTIVHSLFLLFDYQGFYLNRKINYLLITMSISYGCIVSIVKLFDNSTKFQHRIIFLFISLISIYVISTTHSRTNFLILVLYFVFFFIKKNMTKKNIKYLITSIGILLFALSFIIEYLINNFVVIKRIMSLVNNNYADGRQGIIDALIGSFDSYKYIGFGTGGTEVFLMSKIHQPYPHNLFFEFFTEYGIIGAVFSIYLIYFISKLILFKVNWQNNSEKTYGLILIYLLILYIKSFSLYNAYPIFLFIGLLVNRSNTRKTIIY